MPPELQELKEEVTLFDDKELLKVWRNNFKGIQWTDERGNIFRGAVERVISRLKEELSLKSVKVRTLDRVRVHVAFSLIAMLAVALVAIKSGNGDRSTSVNSFRF